MTNVNLMLRKCKFLVYLRINPKDKRYESTDDFNFRIRFWLYIFV